MSRATKPHVESQGTKPPQSATPLALMWPYQGQEVEEKRGKNTQRPLQHTNLSKDSLTKATAEVCGSDSQTERHLRNRDTHFLFFHLHLFHHYRNYNQQRFSCVIINTTLMIITATPHRIMSSDQSLVCTLRCGMFEPHTCQVPRWSSLWRTGFECELGVVLSFNRLSHNGPEE